MSEKGQIIVLGDSHIVWSDGRKIVSIAEHGRYYRGNNQAQKKLSCYLVDDGLIKQGLRCDFALTNDQENKIYLIELKGRDISHAAEQIKSTIDNFSVELKGKIIFARIVCTRVSSPKIRKPSLIKLEQVVAKSCGNVSIASLELKEDL